MQSALDAFRAQREAADQVHARLTEVGQLLEQLTRQVDAVAGNADLRAVLRAEQDWLYQAQRLLADVRHFREQERLRFWPGVWRRWVLALFFALASAAAAGAGYALMATQGPREGGALRGIRIPPAIHAKRCHSAPSCNAFQGGTMNRQGQPSRVRTTGARGWRLLRYYTCCNIQEL